MATVSILLQNKALTSIYPGLDYLLQNNVSIDFLRHFAISIARNLIKFQLRFEIVPDGPPTMLPFFVLVIWFRSVLDTIRTVSFSWPTDNTKGMLYAKFGMHFVTRSDKSPVLEIRIKR
jgi:hypothetical protein